MRAIIFALVLVAAVAVSVSASITPLTSIIKFPSGRMYVQLNTSGCTCTGTYVPYAGATGNVDLGGFDFTSHNVYTSYIGGTVGSLDMVSDPWEMTANLSVAGNILPATTLTYDLGSGAKRWNWLYVSNGSFDDITTNDVAVSGYIDLLESLRPGTPPSGHTYLYAENIEGIPILSWIDEAGHLHKLPGLFPVMNVRGTALPANRFVYATGMSGNTTTVNLAKADNLSTMPAIGITMAQIANGSYGVIMAYGHLENVDTQDGFDVGNNLYVSDTVAGMARNTPPVTPNLTQNMGRLLIEDNLVGAIQVITGPMTGNEFGTIQSDFYIGNGTAGTVRLFFNDGTGTYLKHNSTGLFYVNSTGKTIQLGAG